MSVRKVAGVRSVLLLALAIWFVPTLAEATTAVNVQTVATPGLASAGDSGVSIAASAILTVVVTDHKSGKTVTNLGASVGDGTTLIALPAGWSIWANVVPPGGCLMQPTEFNNWGNGVYTVRVVQSIPGCVWLIGQYHFAPQLNVVVGPKTFTGSGLGHLTIP